MRRDFWALVVIACFGVVATLYARAMPVFEAADEGAHFLYTHNLLETGALPVILSREEVAVQESPEDRWAIETHQPPLYYAIGAMLVFWTDRDDIEDYLRPNDLIFIRGITAYNHNQWLHAPDRGADGQTGLALYLLRGYSIVLGMTTLWFIYQTARLLWQNAALPVLTVLLVASIPTFVSISASYNNDNLVTALYAGGVYWSLRMWRHQRITRTDTIAISAILTMIALTKLNGATLFGVVYLALIVGVWRGAYPARDALRLIGVSLMVTAVFAGWWYVRNFDLYGDPLAISATQSLWGREFEIAATSGDIGAELIRIYRSFWMMMGYLHLPVYGPTWLYIYTGVVTVIGVIGVAVKLLARHTSRDVKIQMGFLLLVCGVVFATLAIGTRSVDISYGRLLFPALIGFAPLIIWGWYHLIRRLMNINTSSPVTATDENEHTSRSVMFIVLTLILPLTLMTVITPFSVMPRAYPSLTVVESLPDETAQLGVSAEGLDLLAYVPHTDTLQPGDEMVFDLYLSGSHPNNPALLATLISPLTLERLGHTEIYPGIAPTDSLDPTQIYRFTMRVPLERVEDEILPPQLLRLRLEWLSPATDQTIPLTVGGAPLNTLLVDGATIIDPRYTVTVPDSNSVEVVFGEMIALVDYVLERDDNTLSLTFYWRMESARIEEDWTLAVQLVNSTTGEVLNQADGMIPGYPTSAWRDESVIVPDTRTLTLPDGIVDYHILVGWYNTERRLTAVGEDIENDLYRVDRERD